MFVSLFVVSFLVALALSAAIAWISREAINSILRRFVADTVVRAGFEKYVMFAMVVAGMGGGVQVRTLQEYISASTATKAALEAGVTQEFWVMELYRTVMGTLEGVAGVLLVCIALALIAPLVFPKLKRERAKTGAEEEKACDPGPRVAPSR